MTPVKSTPPRTSTEQTLMTSAAAAAAHRPSATAQEMTGPAIHTIGTVNATSPAGTTSRVLSRHAQVTARSATSRARLRPPRRPYS